MNMTTEHAITALFVQKNGCYYGIDGVDPWDEERDARLYNGPYPVIAYPPCQRWGKMWMGSPSYVAKTGIRTPEPFKELLISLARSVYRNRTV